MGKEPRVTGTPGGAEEQLGLPAAAGRSDRDTVAVSPRLPGVLWSGAAAGAQRMGLP